jgi:hypothetical protein
MIINVHVQLGPDDTLAYAPDAAAMQVLVALGGNATEDYCMLTATTSSEPGTAGAGPPEQPPPDTQLP